MTLPVPIAILALRALAAALVLAAACGGGDTGTADTAAAAGATATSTFTPPAASADLERQAAAVNAYRLTMDAMDKYIQAQRNVMTMGASMSDAEKQAMMERAPAGGGAAQDADGLAREVEAFAPMRRAVESAGLTPREYATITYAYMAASMAAGIQKMRPNDNADSLARAMKASPENAKFVREHEAELQRKMEALQAGPR